jgi:hypothetical protein
VKYIFFVLTLALASPAFAQNHGDVVQQVALAHPPAKTVDGAFQFTLEVLAALTAQFPQEHAGLLEKVLGENIVPYQGTLVSAGAHRLPESAPSSCCRMCRPRTARSGSMKGQCRSAAS